MAVPFLPSGIDLMRRINDGELQRAPVSYIESIRRKITENCEELIEVGARIRPLMVGDDQVGWVRGIHPHERRMLKRWIKDPNDFVLNVLLLATTFPAVELEEMPPVEVRGLAEVVKRMSEYDMSLFPYLAAYVTTQSSENLWHGKGENLTSFENRIITMPDGKTVKLMAPPEHSRVWASLCTYREQAKRRLEENFNALFVVRPWAGKNADPIQAELRGVARGLETDSMEPWDKVVRIKPTIDTNDGWAHPGDSVEELRREMHGMLTGDKHEQLMEVWQKQMTAEAEEKKRLIDELREKQGRREVGILEERMEVLTDAQMRERQAAMRQGKKPKLPGATRRREDYEIDSSQGHMDKIRKYL